MTSAFDAAVARLRECAHRFDAAAHDGKREALIRLSHVPLRDSATLPRYHELLLFLLAHPSDRWLLARVEGELRRLAGFLRGRRGSHRARLEGEGMPHVEMLMRFSHDCVRWLLSHPHCRVSIDSFGEPKADLNDILRLTLPSVERSETTAGLDNDALFDALGVSSARRLDCVIKQLSRFDALPYVKDHLYDSLDLFVKVTPTDRRLSKAYSRLPMPTVHFQQELLREFDALALMNRALPAPRRLDVAGPVRFAQAAWL